MYFMLILIVSCSFLKEAEVKYDKLEHAPLLYPENVDGIHNYVGLHVN